MSGPERAPADLILPKPQTAVYLTSSISHYDVWELDLRGILVKNYEASNGSQRGRARSASQGCW